MTKTFDFDPKRAEAEILRVNHTLKKNVPILRARKAGYDLSWLASSIAVHALEAAGWSIALGSPTKDIQSLIKTASWATAQLFKLRGSESITEIGDLDTGETRRFVDTGLTDPIKMIDGIYIAVDCGDAESLEYLTGLPSKKYHSEQVEVIEVISQYALALQHVAAGRKAEGLRALKKTLTHWENEPDRDTQYWLRQADVLNGIARQDAAGANDALHELERLLKRMFSGKKHYYDPLRFVLLPVRGLRALGVQRGVFEAGS
jgi:hypothetical protein